MRRLPSGPGLARSALDVVARLAVATAIIGLAVGCGQSVPRQDTEAEPTLVAPQPGPRPGSYRAIVYFATPDVRGLLGETRTIEPQGGADASPAQMAKAVAEAVAAGPKSRGLYPTLPRSAKVLWAKLSAGGVLTLNFSEGLTRDLPAGETGERLAVYSVVNSVAAVPGVKSVVFKVAGKKVNTLVGFFDVSEPVTADTSLLVR